MEIFVGIDPSLTGTAIISLDSKANIINMELISTSSKEVMEKRLCLIRDHVASFLNKQRPNKVCIEGLSFQSKGSAMAQLGALHFLLRIFLFQEKLDYRVVEPTVLKRFVTGKGQGKKELMLKEVYKKWGADFDDNNLADAYGLARIALEDFRNGN